MPRSGGRPRKGQADQAPVDNALARIRIARAGMPKGAGRIADFVLVLVAAIFLASDPDTYRRGLLLLLPTRAEETASLALGDAGAGRYLVIGGYKVVLANGANYQGVATFRCS